MVEATGSFDELYEQAKKASGGEGGKKSGKKSGGESDGKNGKTK